MNGRACEAIAAGRAFSFGEIDVAFGEGRVTLTGPRPGRAPRTLDATVEALRRHVRFDDRGRYRPLSGARTLPGGWRITLPARLAGAALEAVYPLAALHQAQAAAGTLRVAPFAETAARQRGRYRAAGELDAAGRDLARATLCGGCARTPVWAGESASAEAIPCPEACGPLLALCREAARWRAEPPPPAPPDGGVPFAAFETPGNELRETLLLSLSRAPSAMARG